MLDKIRQAIRADSESLSRRSTTEEALAHSEFTQKTHLLLDELQEDTQTSIRNALKLLLFADSSRDKKGHPNGKFKEASEQICVQLHSFFSGLEKAANIIAQAAIRLQIDLKDGKINGSRLGEEAMQIADDSLSRGIPGYNKAFLANVLVHIGATRWRNILQNPQYALFHEYSPWIFFEVGLRHFQQPEQFLDQRLKTARESIDRLKSDKNFEDLADIEGIFEKAALRYEDPEHPFKTAEDFLHNVRRARQVLERAMEGETVPEF